MTSNKKMAIALADKGRLFYRPMTLAALYIHSIQTLSSIAYFYPLKDLLICRVHPKALNTMSGN